jgi:hypothetical protein
MTAVTPGTITKVRGTKMVRIYEDRFKFGDAVTWRDENSATRTGGRKRLGDRLTIKDVHEVSGSRRDVGHTQHVTIMEDPNAGFGSNEHCFSGAYFRHLAPWEKTQ